MQHIPTNELIQELDRRGYSCRLKSLGTILSWNRAELPPAKPDRGLFRWEAVHMIASQLRPDHLFYSDIDEGRVLSARLEFL
jgi:hypothetical protein